VKIGTTDLGLRLRIHAHVVLSLLFTFAGRIYRCPQVLPLVKPPARTTLAGSLNQNVGPHNIENLGPKKGGHFLAQNVGTKRRPPTVGGRRLVPGFWAGKRPPKQRQKTKQKGVVLSGPHLGNTRVIVSAARAMRARPAVKP